MRNTLQYGFWLRSNRRIIYGSFRRLLDGKMLCSDTLSLAFSRIHDGADRIDGVTAETFLNRAWCISSAVALHLRRSFELPKAERSDLGPL